MADDTTPEDLTTRPPGQRRRRATAPAGTPTAPPGGSVDDQLDEGARAAIASAMAQLGPPTTVGPVADTDDEDVPDGDVTDGDVTDDGVTVEDEPDGTDDPEREQGVSGEATAAGAMSVLFQAPAAGEASSPRRRRAVASAGPAQPALFSPPAAGTPDAAAPAGVPSADGAGEGAPQDTADTPSRPRRRRKPAAAANDGTDTTDQAVSAARLLPSPDADGGDPTGGDPSGDGASGASGASGDDATDDGARPAPARRRRRARADEVSPEPAQDAEEPEVAVGGEDPAILESVDDPEEPDDLEDSDGADDSDDSDEGGPRRRRRRGGRGRRRRRAEGAESSDDTDEGDDAEEDDEPSDDAGDGSDEDGEDPSLSRSARRRRRRRRRSGDDAADPTVADSTGDVTSVRGSTRLEAKRQRRREGRDSTRRRTVITEAEFLARRESVERTLLVREQDGRTQIAVLEDGVLVEHYVTQASQQSMIGNVHLGKVQNVLPSMEAAFVDIGRGRNAVLYAGEVNWDAVNLTSKADRRIEAALKPGDPVLVQVTKDPIGHKGARLSSQVSLPGRFVVLVPNGAMTGISRKLPETERNRLKRILKKVVPEDAGVIVRTAAEGAAEEDIERDVARLSAQWEDIKRKSTSVSAPALLYSEPDLAIRVVRDVFNEDISRLVVSGDEAWDTLEAYVGHVAPDLAPRLSRWEPLPDGPADLFAAHRVDEQIAKGLDRKVWLPSGGSLVIDRTEAMTVVDVNTGKFTGSGGDLEETVTRNNLEAAEEIVRQLRLRDIGGIIVVDFIDMVLESNRRLVLRRLVECLGRDRTKHQVAEVTSLGLVQMTRKRVGQGLLEAFSTPCETCHGRGVVVHDHPVESNGRGGGDHGNGGGGEGRDRSRRGRRVDQPA